MCRPNKFDFAKETATELVEEVDSVTNEKSTLLPSSLTINNIYIKRTVNHTDLGLVV